MVAGAVASTILHENASNFHAESGLGHAAYAFPPTQVAMAAVQAAAIELGSEREPFSIVRETVEFGRGQISYDDEVPPSFDLPMPADDHARPLHVPPPHKHPKVKAWLDRHPRFKSHFTPTSSSWMNLVERFFADLTADVIRSGSFASIGELVRDIEAYLSDPNAA
jgi:hypothetical protein